MFITAKVYCPCPDQRDRWTANMGPEKFMLEIQVNSYEHFVHTDFLSVWSRFGEFYGVRFGFRVPDSHQENSSLWQSMMKYHANLSFDPYRSTHATE